MSHGKQFTLYTYVGGPNGWKVDFVLEELGLTYHSIFLDFSKSEQKGPEHTKHNPNGRIPTLIDHKNGDYVIWESNAIILYLIDKYDPEKKLGVTDEKDRYTLIQWLFFQASGQGPYFGQAFWFKQYHPEKIPSAVERYQKEILRVFSVLDGVLSKQEWLVGGKVTAADIALIPWNNSILRRAVVSDMEGVNVEKDYPAFFAWHEKLLARDAIQRVIAFKTRMESS